MLQLQALPQLRDPMLVAAFEGWNDAGEAATRAVTHLATVWQAQPVAELDPEEFYDFQVNRPRAVIENGARRVVWPTTRLLLATETGFGRDVLLVDGIEPSTRWRTYAGELLDYAGRAGVTTLLTLGALLADVPHTRPIPVTATSEDPGAQRRYDVEPSRYEGPTGIVGVLSQAAAEAGLQAVSCWAAVPHYAGGPPSPKATLALIARVEQLFDLAIPRADLPDAARAWERGVNELSESDDEVAEYVQSLEAATDSAELPEASGDAIAREFERYLRRRGDDGPPTA